MYWLELMTEKRSEPFVQARIFCPLKVVGAHEGSQALLEQNPDIFISRNFRFENEKMNFTRRAHSIPVAVRSGAQNGHAWPPATDIFAICYITDTDRVPGGWTRGWRGSWWYAPEIWVTDQPAVARTIHCDAAVVDEVLSFSAICFLWFFIVLLAKNELEE